MTRALFVGDGPRDAKTIPKIVETVLGRALFPETRSWKDIRLHHTGGYKRAAAHRLG